MNHVYFAKTSRCGYTLMETLVACGLVGTALALATPVWHKVGEQRAAIRDEQLALQEAANTLETWLARPVADLVPQPAADVPLSSTAQQTLRQGRQVVWIAEETDPPARRITVEIDWQLAGGATRPPLKLVGWAFEGKR